MTQMESPKRKMQKKNDYQRHKLFRKIKRRRKAQAEAEQQIAEKQLRRKLKLPKFGDGKEKVNLDNAHFDKEGNLVDNTTGIKYIPTSDDVVITPNPYRFKDNNITDMANYTSDNKLAAKFIQSEGFDSGKDIHIKKSKRGTFTKAAKQHGMSVQGFANMVLRNPSKYSAAMRKKANFAHNASKWNK